MIWKILYSPYDAGALIIMLIGLAAHLIADLIKARRASSAEGGARRPF
jgi:hypothetical protein